MGRFRVADAGPTFQADGLTKSLGKTASVSSHTIAPIERQCFGLSDRGIIRTGMAADVVVFDPATVIDRSTFEDPRQFPVGIEHVLVNGTPVIADSAPTGARPGRALRRG